MDKKEAEKLFKSKYAKDKLKAVKAGYFHEECLSRSLRSYSSLRVEVAKQGHYLEELSKDEKPIVRAEVAKQGYKPEIMLNDESEIVRSAVYLRQIENEDGYEVINDKETKEIIDKFVEKYKLKYKTLHFKKSNDFVVITLISPSFYTLNKKVFNKLSLISYDCNHVYISKDTINVKTGEIIYFNISSEERSLITLDVYKILENRGYISKGKIKTLQEVTKERQEKKEKERERKREEERLSNEFNEMLRKMGTKLKLTKSQIESKGDNKLEFELNELENTLQAGDIFFKYDDTSTLYMFVKYNNQAYILNFNTGELKSLSLWDNTEWIEERKYKIVRGTIKLTTGNVVNDLKENEDYNNHNVI